MFLEGMTVKRLKSGTLANMLGIALLGTIIAFFCSEKGVGIENHVKESKTTEEKSHALRPSKRLVQEDPDIGAMRLENAAKKGLDKLEEQKCESRGLVRYHGRCMTEKEKTALFELEIIHIGKMIDEAVKTYQTSTPEHVAWLFLNTEEFIDKFEDDRVIDVRIARQVLVLLGFLYIPADRLVNEMKSKLADSKGSKDPFVIIKTHSKLETFSKDVYIPLMEALAKQIDLFVQLHGEEQFNKFMIDNSLERVLRRLE